MKKILLAVAVVLAATSIGCSEASKEAAKSADTLKTQIESCSDPDSLAVYVKQAQDYAQQLIDSGKTEEAKAYLSDLTPTIEKKDPSLKERWQQAVSSVESTITNAGDSVASKAHELTDSAKAKGEALKDAATEKASDIVDKTKDAASSAADKTKAVANDAVDKTKNAASNVADKTKEGVEKAKEGTKKAVEDVKNVFKK